MILSKKRVTKARNRLGRYAGWSVPLLVATPRIQFPNLAGKAVRSITRCEKDESPQNSGLQIRVDYFFSYQPKHMLWVRNEPSQ